MKTAQATQPYTFDDYIWSQIKLLFKGWAENEGAKYSFDDDDKTVRMSIPKLEMIVQYDPSETGVTYYADGDYDINIDFWLHFWIGMYGEEQDWEHPWPYADCFHQCFSLQLEDGVDTGLVKALNKSDVYQGWRGTRTDVEMYPDGVPWA